MVSRRQPGSGSAHTVRRQDAHACDVITHGFPREGAHTAERNGAAITPLALAKAVARTLFAATAGAAGKGANASRRRTRLRSLPTSWRGAPPRIGLIASGRATSRTSRRSKDGCISPRARLVFASRHLAGALAQPTTPRRRQRRCAARWSYGPHRLGCGITPIAEALRFGLRTWPVLRQYGIIATMSRTGDCHDGAPWKVLRHAQSRASCR